MSSEVHSWLSAFCSLDISLCGLMRQAQMPETICANVVMHLEDLGLYHAACLQLRGERINAIACLSSSGILAVESIRGTVNGETFFDFLRGTLIPQMMPFNGSNPHSILVMDNNCSIHHTHEVKDLLNQAGVLALYLPPYSPDLNPIEEAFSYVKSYLRKHDDIIQAGIPLVSILKSAFESISACQCNAWITDSGYST